MVGVGVVVVVVVVEVEVEVAQRAGIEVGVRFEREIKD